MKDQNIIEQGERLIEQLSLIKDEYIKTKNALSVSIRKDLVAVELKDILLKNKDYTTLSEALTSYINKLI